LPITAECATLVSAWEGLPDGDPTTVNLDPYMDPVGIWTIGYGRALRSAATGRFLIGACDRRAAFAQYPGGITKAQARSLLGADLGRFAAQVTALAGQATPPQLDALVAFDFNTGHLAGSTLLKLHLAAGPSGEKLGDSAIRALHATVIAKSLGRPASIRDALAACSFAKGTFLGGLFCRRLAEWTLYRGAPAVEANAFGAHVRAVIAR